MSPQGAVQGAVLPSFPPADGRAQAKQVEAIGLRFPYSPWQQRLRDEHRELATRVEKLDTYVLTKDYKALSEEDRGLLSQQLNGMKIYLLAIRARVARLPRW